MNFEKSEIIDSNGQKYRAGWDEYGWFTIQEGEMVEVEGSMEFLKFPGTNNVSFPADKVDDVIRLMSNQTP